MAVQWDLVQRWRHDGQRRDKQQGMEELSLSGGGGSQTLADVV
jgi:hypothetical protein